MHKRYVAGIAGLALAGLAGSVGAAAVRATARSPVLLVGDSMMRLPGMAMERDLARLSGVQAYAFSGIGTGLARLDAFDWLAKFAELCSTHAPKTAVVALGANDRQPMQLPEGRGVAQPDSPEWENEYATRLGQAMDVLIEGGCERVIWLLLPPMRDPSVDRFAKRVNALIASAAATRPKVSLFDVGSVIADRRSGGFTERITDPQTAASTVVRDRDGIHLAPLGARLLSRALIDTYWDRPAAR